MQPKLRQPNLLASRIIKYSIYFFQKKTGIFKIAFLGLALLLLTTATYGQWAAVSTAAPNNNKGVMLLLSNGTVMCKSNAGTSDGYGDTWNLLSPDAAGNYASGTWSTLARMAKTRLYFVSQVLQDGRVYVAGGEYGTGGNFMEIYNPLTNAWGGELNYGNFISDANSEILPNGRVLVAPVNNAPTTYIWNPADNTFTAGPSNLGGTNESAWVKLPDGSILFVRTNSSVSERYIPATNTWQADATVPVSLYSTYGAETGAAFMLPDGRAFFLGGNSNTAYYTPSGTTANGTWAAGPVIPNSLSAPDAAAAMMRDGRILCAVSPTLTYDAVNNKNIFNTPTSFYTFDYTTNSFTSITAPDGTASINMASYNTNMLDLPNGQILYSQQGSSQYYVYTPGAQLAANRPVISSVAQNGDGSFTLTGTQINGWSEGAGYGDDWQMNTNYPIVKLTNGANAYYARTYNWSSTGVRTGATPVTTDFTLPAGLPNATYQMVVIANGIQSDPITFCTPNIDANTSVTSNYNGRDVSCFNACNGAATVSVIGAVSPTYSWTNIAAPATIISTAQSVSGLCPGTYSVTVTNGAGGCSVTKTVTIHNAPLLTVAPTATSNFNGYNISCNGGTNGTATANAGGGTPPYTYSWSNGQTSANATVLSATTYSVTVTDANNCKATSNVTLTQPPVLKGTAAPTSDYNGYNVQCHGGSNGTAEAYPTGGVSPYTYLWSNGQTGKVATGLSATTYSVTITDANGCSFTPPSITLTEPPQLTINAGPNKIVYVGYPDSSCTNLTYSGQGGGVPPYVITWSTGSTAQTINVCPIVTTTYTVTIVDKNGCSFSDEVTVCVIDVRCGNKLDNVVISHMTGNVNNPCITICLDIHGAKNHFLQHKDDQLAACGTSKICNDAAPLLIVGNTIKKELEVSSVKGDMYVQPFPNPFSSATEIKFMSSEEDMVQLILSDISGKQLKTLYNAKVQANKMYSITLNGSSLSNGMYLLQLKTLRGKSYVGKLIVSK